MPTGALTGAGAKRLVCYGLVLAAAFIVMLVAAGPALAGARWKLVARAAPTQLPTKGEGFITVQAVNLGDAAPKRAHHAGDDHGHAAGGVHCRRSFSSEGDSSPGRTDAEPPGGRWEMQKPSPRVVSCTYDTSGFSPAVTPIQPYENLEIWIKVAIDEPAGTPENEVTVEGGQEQAGSVEGAVVPGAGLKRSLAVVAAATPFGSKRAATS